MMPSEGFDEWLASQRAWRAAHPGYCPRCGLPDAYCFHVLYAYQRDQEAAKMAYTPGRPVWEPRVRVDKEWYLNTLKRMPRTEIAKLPVPHRKVLGDVFKNWWRTQPPFTDAELNPGVVYPTIWERLLADAIL